MISQTNYKHAFFIALGLHIFLIFLLLKDPSSQRPVLTKENHTTPGIEQTVHTPQSEIVKAISVDSKAVMETLNKLKQEREQQQQAEIQRKQALNQQLELAKQQRIKEQQQIAKLKEEANRIAIARKKQVEEEKKRLQKLAEQKAAETQRIEALKKQKEALLKQQALEAKKLAELNQKKALEQAKTAKEEAEKTHAAQLKNALEKKKQAETAAAEKQAKEQARQQAQQQAQQQAEQQARLAGEVDKYKALIVNAIGKNWILPEHVDSSLSSQFRIRLAPNGLVLDVTLIRSSGDPLLDRSAQTAIYRASPLPVPTDAETFNLFRDISLTVRPEQVRG